METREAMRQLYTKGAIRQVGFFTRDIFQAMVHWDKVLGVDNWTLYAHSQERLQTIARREGLCGEDFKFYAACAMLGDMQIELIQPLYGLPIYEDYLSGHGEGAHHMKLVVPKGRYDEVLDDLAKQACRCCSAQSFSAQNSILWIPFRSWAFCWRSGTANPR